MALSLANLDPDVKGARLEGNYVRVNDGLGPSAGIRTKRFGTVPTRLRKTVVYGDGAYKKGEIVDEHLIIFENVRLGENTGPSQMRTLLVDQGEVKNTEEFNPVGRYALSEMPGATKGLPENNRLMDQNSYRILKRVEQKVDHSTVIGRNANMLPPGTNVSTVESYLEAFNNVRNEHNQENQNEYHKQNFYIARGMSGLMVHTPPPSPLNQDLDYESDDST